MVAFNDYLADIKEIIDDKSTVFETDFSVSDTSSGAVVAEMLKSCGKIVHFLDGSQEKIGFSLLTCIGNLQASVKSIYACLEKVKKNAPPKKGGGKKGAAEEENKSVIDIRVVLANIESLQEEFLDKMDKSPLHLFFASLRCGHRGNSYLIEPLFKVTQTIMSSGGLRSNNTFIKQIRSWKSFKYIFRYSFIGMIYKARIQTHILFIK